MEIKRAAELLRGLADGRDPITGARLPDESVYNHPEIIRALHCVLQELQTRQTGAQAVNAGRSWRPDEEQKLLEEYDGYALVAAVGEFCDIYQTAGDDGSPHCGMSWDALAEAAASPRLEVANHSYYFHHMGARPGTGQKDGESKSDWSAAFASDISRMQDAVREHCGLTPQSFTYPFGQETAGADAILKDLGIQASFNSREEVARLRRGHPEDLYSIGRFCRDGRISTEAFLARWEQSAGG